MIELSIVDFAEPIEIEFSHENNWQSQDILHNCEVSSIKSSNSSIVESFLSKVKSFMYLTIDIQSLALLNNIKDAWILQAMIYPNMHLGDLYKLFLQNSIASPNSSLW